MASLVADYGSDSATSEEDEDPGPEELHGEAELRHKNSSRDSPVSAQNNPERNYFMPVDSEEEEEEEANKEDVVERKRPSSDPNQQNAVKFPKPNFDSVNSPTRPSGNDGHISVFANPYRAAEEARNSLLEKHVKMTPTGNNQQRSIMGKKVCWNYRKGRCRFGSTCKFAHDSDIAITKQTVSATESATNTEVASGENSFVNQRQ